MKVVRYAKLRRGDFARVEVSPEDLPAHTDGLPPHLCAAMLVNLAEIQVHLLHLKHGTLHPIRAVANRRAEKILEVLHEEAEAYEELTKTVGAQ